MPVFARLTTATTLLTAASALAQPVRISESVGQPTAAPLRETPMTNPLIPSRVWSSGQMMPGSILSVTSYRTAARPQHDQALVGSVSFFDRLRAEPLPSAEVARTCERALLEIDALSSFESLLRVAPQRDPISILDGFGLTFEPVSTVSLGGRRERSVRNLAVTATGSTRSVL
ncbi:MAG: hypothetical protein AAGI17_00515 [Planctomycetota bacterium]